MAHRFEATLTDRVLLIPHVAKVLTAAVWRGILSGVLGLGGPKANTVLKDMLYAAFRQNLRSVNAAQEQLLNQSSEAVYLDLAKKGKFHPETTVLPSGVKLHWFGPRSSKKVLLYFHGGGYSLGPTPAHMQWIYDLQKDLSKSHSFSVVHLGYTLTHQGQYPLQLQQASEALQFLLKEQGLAPGDIFVGGDSAGGNLTLALFSHILHPHPEVPKIELKQPLASAILVSPWVKFTTEDDSVSRNATSDLISPVVATRWSSQYKGGKASDEYNEPILAPSEWWTGLDKVVKDIIIWGGGGELLIDSIRAIDKKLKAAHPKVELVVQDGAGHEDFIWDVLLHYPKPEGIKLIESWVGDRL